jgi:predicted DCC family thiol-disulfide oxidoreductase YuxK
MRSSANPATVYFDRDCGFCQWSVSLVRRLDWTRAFRFVPLQSDEARNLGLEESRNLSQMVLARAGRQWGGWRAVKQLLYRLPLFYLMLAASQLPGLWWPSLLPVSATALALFLLALSPLGNPAGDALYRWVARNRHRFPGSTCSLENR